MMLLHIDKETKIPVCDIVGIFDLDSATVSSISKRFLKQQQEAGTLYTTNLSLPRSFVVWAEDETDCCTERKQRSNTKNKSIKTNKAKTEKRTANQKKRRIF